MENKKNRMETFFKYDVAVKNILCDCTFKEIDNYNIDGLINYQTKLHNALKDIEFYIIKTLEMFDYDKDTIQSIRKKFNIYLETLAKCKLNEKSLKSFYNVVFADMDENLIKELKENCAGYSMFSDNTIVNKATTLNEMLHCIHHYITNNEVFYQEMPIIEQKNNNEGYPITLYGKSNDISKEIFTNFPDELDCGWTDIIGLDNKVLMMIRDRGHALTIDMTIEEKDILVKYFIPKLCNIEMINNLKGVNKVTEQDKYTVGSFVVPKEKVSNEIISFISKVPTDADMVLPKTL